MGYLRMLRRRHLATLWLSQVLSSIGDNFFEIATLWIAVRAVGGGAGKVAAAGAVAALVFGLLGGVYADRWDRRRSMIAADVLRALAVAALPALALTNRLQLWHLAAVAAIVGGLGALFNPALQASLPALAGDLATLNATNGLMDVTRRLARAVGPSLAGVLAAALPIAHFFSLDALSFLVSALAIASLGQRYAWQPIRPADVPRGVRGIVSEIAAGARLVRGHETLLAALLTSWIVSAAWSAAFTVGVPVLANQVLRSGIGAYGLIVGAYGVGNVLSNLVVGGLVIRRRAATIFGGRAIVGLGFLVLALAPSLPVALVGVAFAALGGPMGDLTTLAMMQTDLPTEHFGKAHSLRITGGSLGMSFGLLLAGPLFALLPVRTAIGGCALAMIAAGAFGLLRFGFAATPLGATVAGERLSG